VIRKQVFWIIAAAVVLTGVATVLSQTKTTNVSAALGYGVAASVVTLIAGMLTDQLKSVLDRRADFNAELARGVFQPRGKLPRVRDVANPVTIGVHPAAPQSGTRVPAYVPRDRDVAIQAALRSSGFILLVGDAAAGKSRTAFEAMRAALPGHLLIAPDQDRPADAAPAITRACAARECVLWLDNLQAFLGNGAITRKDIAELLAGPGHHRVVLATMGAADEARLTGRLAGRDRTDPLIQAGQGVVEQVTQRVFLDRLLSVGERIGASQPAATDRRIADALRYADRYGIGEYLVSGPQLQNQWEDAWARGHRPRAAALITSAVDCRRAGFTGPLPQALLESLHEKYLVARGGATLIPEDISETWDWVLAQRESGSAPLRLLSPGYYDVFEYLVDTCRRDRPEPVPDHTVRTALDQASPADVGNIAATVWQEDRYELARIAIERQYAAVSQLVPPDDLNLLGIRTNLATASLQLVANTSNPFALLAAEEEYRAILTAIAARPGTDPGFMLRVRCNLATVFYRQYKLAEAEAQFRAALDCAVTLSSDDSAVLVTRGGLAALLDRTGDLGAAADEFRAVLAVYRRKLGPDHPDTRLIEEKLATVERRWQAAQAQPDG
jgi:eukaryotic-like serine/threonine-protein kinase